MKFSSQVWLMIRCDLWPTVSTVTHYPFLGDLHVLFFYPSFLHASYAIYIRYQCFHSVNLTLHTVTTIHSSQLTNKIQLEPRKQDESYQKIQDPWEKERERNQVGKEKSLRKKNKKSFSMKKLLMEHLKLKLTLLFKNILWEIIHAYIIVNKWWSIISLF